MKKEKSWKETKRNEKKKKPFRGRRVRSEGLLEEEAEEEVVSLALLLKVPPFLFLCSSGKSGFSFWTALLFHRLARSQTSKSVLTAYRDNISVNMGFWLQGPIDTIVHHLGSHRSTKFPKIFTIFKSNQNY